VQGRGPLYEQLGTVRDVVQNHLLQVVALLAMEPPVGADADALRDEKVKVLRAMRPFTRSGTVRGQYRGYRDEPGVAADSIVETYAALRTEIDSWRWVGVPFVLRTAACEPSTPGLLHAPPTAWPLQSLTRALVHCPSSVEPWGCHGVEGQPGEASRA
jgi:glucose-6-phosphate 1-dehydrogenase